MFRGVNLKDSNIDNIKFIIMKNVNEPYGEVLKDYVKNIIWKFQDVDEMTIEVPSKILSNGRLIDEPMYDMFLGKQQQLIVELGETKQRFIVVECTREINIYKGENGEETPYKIKKIQCKSYEYTLSDKYFIAPEDLSRQLYYDNSITTGAIDISDGYLNMLVEDTDWEVLEVTEKAKKQFNKSYNEFYVNINDITILNMKKGTTIWEKGFNITPVGQNVVNLKALYTHIKSYDNNNKLLIDNKKVHDTNLNKIYTGVKHIKAIYDGNEDYRYAIHYIITLVDGEIVDRWEDLDLYLDNQKVVFSGMILAYEDGSESVISNFKNIMVSAGTYKYLDLLYQNICNGFDIVLIFDTYNMTVSAYDRSEVGENKGLEFSWNFIKSINKKEQYDNVFNKVSVNSSQTSIIDENPFGTSYILDYSYHYNHGLMSEELMDSWDRFLKHIDGKQADLYELRLSKNTYNRRLEKENAELYQLNLAIRDLQLRRVDYQKKNADGKGVFDIDIKTMSQQINTKQDKASELLKEIQSIKDNVATINIQIKDILKDISLEGAIDSKGLIFTKDLIKELNSITIEKIIDDSDNYYTTSLGLYNYTKDKLTRANSTQIEFDIVVAGVLQNLIIPNGVDWNYFLSVGDFVTLIDGEDDIKTDDERGLRIVQIDYSPCEFNISKITFSNNEKAEDDLKGASNIGHAMNTNNNFINNSKPTIQNSVTVNDYINAMLTDGLDVSATNIRSRAGRVKYDQTEAGMFFISAGENEDSQIYIGDSILAFTSDRWLTSKCAISDEGITADYLIGRVLLGKQLYICNSNSDGSISDEFYIGNMDKFTHEPDNNGENFGLRIAENSAERIVLGVEIDSDGIRRAKLRLKGRNGELCLSEDGILVPNQFSVPDSLDNQHPMIIPFNAMRGTTKFKEVTLNLFFDNYRAYERGTSSAPAQTTGSTTSDGGSYVNTTAGGGGFSISRSSENNTVMTDLYGASTDNATNMGIGQSLIDAINSGNSAQVNLLISNHKHPMDHYSLIHTHYMEIQQDSHFHGISIPNHNHQISIDIPSHRHDLEYGIFTSTIPSNCSVYVNDVLVSNGLNSTCTVDITSAIKIDQMNIIKITSATAGRIVANISSKQWITW